MGEELDDSLIIQVGELTENVKNEIQDYVTIFSVGLFGHTEQRGYYYAGSGTLVQVDPFRYILTAAHVWETIQEAQTACLSLTTSPSLFERPRASLEPFVLRGQEEEWGPDLAFLRLPEPFCEDITAHSNKAFYNLSSRREVLLGNVIPKDMGVWGVVGAPAEQCEFNESQARLNVIVSLGGQPQITVKDGFDYYDSEVNYADAVNVPINFGGVSGGGIWHFALGMKDKKVQVISKVLAGVVFYQSPIKKNKRLLRGHGIESIYRHGINHLLS